MLKEHRKPLQRNKIITRDININQSRKACHNFVYVFYVVGSSSQLSLISSITSIDEQTSFKTIEFGEAQKLWENIEKEGQKQ